MRYARQSDGSSQFDMMCTAPKLWPQYLLTVLCNLGTLSFGLHSGWLAPLHLRLMSADSPLERPLTTEEISWIGSIPAVSFLLGTFVFGCLLQKVGRRPSALLAVAPNILCFLVLMLSHNVYMIYAARFLAGFTAAGAVLVTPVYVNESAGEDIRGFLCGLSAFFVNIGVLISATAGGYFPYWLFNAICLSFSLVFVAFYPWLPETPVFLASRGKTKEASEVLKKLGRETEPELATETGDHRKGLRDLLSDGTFTRSLFLGVGVMTAHQSSADAPPSSRTPPKSSTSPAAACRRAGRKFLLMASLIVMGTCLCILSVFTFLRNRCETDGFGWVPAATIFVYMIGFSSGIGSVSFVLVTELFLPEVRGISGAVCGAWASILGFVSIKFFPVVAEQVSLACILAAYAVFCSTGTLFAYFFVVETRGKSSREIVDLLARKRTETDLEMRGR
ncbi:UNVERIFIED_CONTAM: hypothetical protein PYX00_008555 [Menopon gallinae]|uniref:Major facilitator superfamily (MFS) profile domain-containing protein n=1 Tax=Menopon gallinae TaxID=328185 RepID=A0AAW2HNP2_9NEOP